MKLTGLALALFLVPAGATAQDLLGTIEATVDGQARTWYLTAQDGESQSDFAQIMRGMNAVSLFGHPTDDSITAVKGALLIDFSLITLGGTPSVADATLQYLEDGYGGGYLATTDGATQVSLDAVEVKDDTLHIEGHFAATAAYSDDIMRQTTDDSRTITLNGSFRATVPGS
ncbi:MAG: hypothetical protein ACP5DX_06070 [Paracoccaceae bacterium]